MSRPNAGKNRGARHRIHRRARNSGPSRLESLERTRVALPLCDYVRSGGIVLDVGCGTGYGTALLASGAARAIGFDIAEEAIDFARSHHSGDAEFLVASADSFPVRTGSVRTVTAFEVIEHIAAWPSLITEASRVLDQDGVFLVSTPNKSYYAETRKESGPNPFHVHEFEYEEFEQSLAGHFPYVQIVGQNRQEAFIFSRERAPNELRGFVGSTAMSNDAHFFVAVCTKKPLVLEPFAFVPHSANLLRERENYIQALQNELAFVRGQQRDLMQHHKKLTAELEEHNAWALGLDRELGEVRRVLAAEQANSKEAAAAAERYEAEADEKGQKLKRAYTLLEEAENRVETERTEWALRLQQKIEELGKERHPAENNREPLSIRMPPMGMTETAPAIRDRSRGWIARNLDSIGQSPTAGAEKTAGVAMAEAWKSARYRPKARQRFFMKVVRAIGAFSLFLVSPVLTRCQCTGAGRDRYLVLDIRAKAAGDRIGTGLQKAASVDIPATAMDVILLEKIPAQRGCGDGGQSPQRDHCRR